MVSTTNGGGSDTPFNFALIPTHTPEQLLNNVRYALTLGLPEVKHHSAAHDGILAIAGGGPSLADTYKDLTGYVAAVNGSLSYLLDKGIKPQMCGVCDPSVHMVNIVEAEPGVTYFIASCVHRGVFDKLLAAGCTVYLWHLHPIEGLDALLDEHYPDGWVQIPGGCTMGTRWLTLGYHLGFRKFHIHGLDSSFRDKSSHAYADHQDTKEWIGFDGYQTRIPFLGQVTDFIGLMEDGLAHDVEPTEITMFGEGLLQTRYAKWLKANPAQGFKWPETDTLSRRYVPAEARDIAKFMDFIPKRDVVVQAGGGVGVYPAYLAHYFKEVHTFEPDPVNYSFLVENLNGNPKITHQKAALGARAGSVGTRMHQAGNIGAVRVVEGGPVPMVTIDSLDLPECDLIWLDIEGYEVNALKGAERTIDRFHPVVIIETMGNERLHGLTPNAATDWLKASGYVPEAKFGNDLLCVYAGK